MRPIQPLLLLALGSTLIGLASTPASAVQSPDWWTDPAYGIFEDGYTGPTDHNAPVNIGQLKFVATQAKAYWDSKLDLRKSDWDSAFAAVGGSNPFPFATGHDSENFAPANAGQVKFLAAAFYEILYAKALYLDIRGQLLSQGLQPSQVKDGPPFYPWTAASSSEHHAPANLGQLKLVFSFEYPQLTDSDADLLPDEWELYYFSGSLAQDGEDDSDGDGIRNSLEWQLNTDPTSDESAVPNLRTDYTYTLNGRLSEASGNVTINYLFDAEGNLRSAN